MTSKKQFPLPALGIFAFALFVFFAGAHLYWNQEVRLFESKGVEIQATIDKTYPAGRNRKVQYHFQDKQGQTYTGDDDYNHSDWQTLKAGDAIRVVYLPDDPERNYTAFRLSATKRPMGLVPAFIFLPLVVSGLCFLLEWRRRRKQTVN